MTAQLTPATLPDYVRSVAPSYGVDPAAALAMAQHEGMVGGHGNPGDGNTSFGPWQLHIGGALPSNIGALGPVAAQQWAWSTDGVNYALQSMANDRFSPAKGLFGQAATAAIAGWERSTDIPGQAWAAWQSYTGWLGTNIPIALDNFFNVVTPGGTRQQQGGDGNPIVTLPTVTDPTSNATANTSTTTEVNTTTHATGGGAPSQDLRLGAIGPLQIGMPSGLMLGLFGLSLLLIGAILFGFNVQNRVTAQVSKRL